MSDEAEKAADKYVLELQQEHPDRYHSKYDVKRDFLAGYSAAMQWRPMKDAPKDGTAILSIWDACDIPKCIAWMRADEPRYNVDKDGWYHTWDHYQLADADIPTGWLPLPPSETPNNGGHSDVNFILDNCKPD